MKNQIDKYYREYIECALKPSSQLDAKTLIYRAKAGGMLLRQANAVNVGGAMIDKIWAAQQYYLSVLSRII